MAAGNMFCKTIIFLFLMFELSICTDDEFKVTHLTVPLFYTGLTRYYLGIFFKANWFRAQQYCLFHGMHPASITSQEENDKLQQIIKKLGYSGEHFWTSGTDLAEEGHFFWMANGRSLSFENWHTGKPNNKDENEDCLILIYEDNSGLKWHDLPCSDVNYFICEVRTETLN